LTIYFRLKVKGSFDVTSTGVNIGLFCDWQYQPPKMKKAPAHDGYAAGYDDDFRVHNRTTGNYGNAPSMSILPVLY